MSNKTLLLYHVNMRGEALTSYKTQKKNRCWVFLFFFVFSSIFILLPSKKKQNGLSCM